MRGKRAFMRWIRAIDGGHCPRTFVGCSPVRAIFRLRRFISAVSNCFAPLRGLAADPALIPFACCTGSTVRAAVITSMQARGEGRAPRFNY